MHRCNSVTVSDLIARLQSVRTKPVVAKRTPWRTAADVKAGITKQQMDVVCEQTGTRCFYDTSDEFLALATWDSVNGVRDS